MSIDIKKLVKLGGSEPGTIGVDPNTSFQAGQIATYDANGAATLAGSGDNPVGIFKWDKTSTVYAVSAREAVTIVALETAYSFAHANVSSVLVEDLAGSDYTVTTDYTISATNGTITTTASGTTSITAGETVYVTYTYEMTAADKEQAGVNFFNSNDDTQGSNKITMLQGGWRVYTDQFETDQNYAMNNQLYVSANGKFTSAALTYKVGRVVSIPTASDPFLGVEGEFTGSANNHV
jgi:hypothetical protein